MAQATQQAAGKKEEITNTKSCQIKHENPSNDGSFLIESVFIDATDEFPPADNGKVQTEALSDSDGSEAYTYHNESDTNYEYDVRSSTKKIKCDESQPTLEIKNYEIDEDNETELPPVIKRVKCTEQLAMGSRQKKPQNKISRRCATCNKSFHHILRHMVEAHSAIERPFECFICRKTYKRFEHLKYHMVTHGDKRDYICHFCGDAFFSNSHLRKHIFNRHTDIKPYHCSACGKCFKTRRSLTVHERTHQNLKPYPCKICSAVSFSTIGALRIHERKHSGEKAVPLQSKYLNIKYNIQPLLKMVNLSEI